MASGTRVVVAMSGGVDSSVAAALLVEQGCDVVGVTMRLWNGPSESGCCSLDDFLEARSVAERLGIPFYVMDFEDDFRRTVVDDFVAQYRRGQTPNPCARCNQFVKFGSLWERARQLGADAIATGHYARVCSGPDGPELRRATDPDKDQSYFLFSVDRSVLQHALFPVGNIDKQEVRRLARDRGLPVADKAESQEVCFAPRGTHAAFVEEQPSHVALRRGDLMDASGTTLGRHGGVHRFTIGQRRGLGLSGGGDPRYVTAIDGQTGVVRIGGREGVLSDGLSATGVNWLAPRPRPGARVTVKIRSRFAPEPAHILEADETAFSLRAEGRLYAATPGQAAVLYDGDRVLGGGWITGALRFPAEEEAVLGRAEGV
jgi:tRNA-specific 2-thiouridylase